ncbi:MAG: PilW family protein [Bacillota bacterium]
MTRAAGFTLVEVVIALSIFSLVFGAAMTLYQQTVTSWHKENARTDVQENLRLGLESMSRDLRSAVGFFQAGSSSVKFALGDGNIVQYYLEGSRLVRQVGGVPTPIANLVVTLTFSYFDENNSLLPIQQGQVGQGDLGKICRVGIVLAGSKGTDPVIRMTTSVTVRAVATH